MGAKAACEKAVAVRHLEDVLLGGAVGGEASGYALGPVGKVITGVSGYDRLAGGTAGSVETDYVLERGGKCAKRIIVAQVLLLHKRQLADVVDRFDVAGLHPRFVHTLAIELNVVVSVLDDLDQPFALELAQLGAVHCLDSWVIKHCFTDCAPLGRDLFLLYGQERYGG